MRCATGIDFLLNFLLGLRGIGWAELVGKSSRIRVGPWVGAMS